MIYHTDNLKLIWQHKQVLQAGTNLTQLDHVYRVGYQVTIRNKQ